MTNMINYLRPVTLAMLFSFCQTALAQEIGGNDSKSPAPSESASSQKSFLPVWKLLSNDQKQEFVAGYIQGWHDAAMVTDIAITYIKQNPRDAINGLERIKSVYDLSAVKPDAVVQAIDEFYSNPENGAAPLSLAITSARNR